MALFDANIDLTEHAIPPGLPPVIAMERVRTAVQAMAGAGAVAVTWCAGHPRGQPWVEVRRRDVGGLRWSDEAGERLATLVRAEVRRALFPSLAVARSDQAGG
jgi:hypothetical protein